MARAALGDDVVDHYLNHARTEQRLFDEAVTSTSASACMSAGSWPVASIRFARPTDKLADLLRFYEEGLGLRRIDSFEDHDGYSGVMLGLPGEELHLELTTHSEGSPGPAPTRDNLLVLSMTDAGAIAAIDERMRSLGHAPVEPENPYWGGDLTFEDPDGWRVVLRYVS